MWHPKSAGVLVILVMVLGALAAGILSPPSVGSLTAGTASADPAVPNPGHSYTEIEVPTGTWTGLDADKLDGMHAGQTGTNYVPYADASGNVGIGTITPSSVLDIQGSRLQPEPWLLAVKNTATADFAHSIIRAECSSTSNKCQPGINFVRPSGTIWEISIGAQDYTTDFLGFANINTGQMPMVLTPSGKVGIGTTSPNAKLQVAGGDAAVSTQGNGLILRATDGSNCYRLTVNNAGTLSTALVSCP